RGGEYYDPVFFQSVGIIHKTIAPYTPQQNGVAKRKNKALKEMVNSMLSYSGLSEGFCGEAMLMACYLLNKVPNKRNKTTPYELWYKKRPTCHFCGFGVLGPLLGFQTKKGNFRPKDIIPNSNESQRDDHSNDVPSETLEPHRAYSDARWINHVEDSSSTSGWVFLLGGGVTSWAFKKQTCITGSTIESKFVALAAIGKEA
nr:zinc finger, CCHC-type [Tanacetum cinerariifolium]